MKIDTENSEFDIAWKEQVEVNKTIVVQERALDKDCSGAFY
jgi:hypothetical protein